MKRSTSRELRPFESAFVDFETMQIQFHRVVRAFVIAACFAAATSCANIWKPIETLVDHPSPVVSVPSTVGAAAGGCAGVGVTIAALPVTLPVAYASGDEGDANMLPLAPLLATSQLVAMVVGGPFWAASPLWEPAVDSQAEDASPTARSADRASAPSAR